MSAETLVKTKNSQRRYFYHYNKQQKKMTIHWKGTCTCVDEIVCYVPAETKTSKNQPHYVLQGWANVVEFHEHANGKILVTIS